MTYYLMILNNQKSWNLIKFFQTPVFNFKNYFGVGWVGEKLACVDLTGVSLLVGLMTEDFTVGHATLKAASSKVAKHERAYYNN
jgi:hypothetical protein